MGFPIVRAIVLVLLGLTSGSIHAGPSDVILRDSFEGPSSAIGFLAPYQAEPQPPSAVAGVEATLDVVDVYLLLDRSGSMASENNSIRANAASAIINLRCMPNGAGSPPDCVPDLWAGAGTIGYAGSGADAYRNFIDLQSNPNFSSLPITEPGGCCAEPLVFSVYAAISGAGGADYGFGGVAPRASCSGSPAATQGFATYGYPCFRAGALPLLVLFTDEPPLSAGDTSKVPNWNTIGLPAMQDRAARLLGITGSGAAVAVTSDLQSMAIGTGAVDARASNQPIVVAGADAGATTAMQNAVRTAVRGTPLRLDAEVVDAPGDAIDAATAFVQRIETAPLGTPQCTAGLASGDSDGDTVHDHYLGVVHGTALCWRVVAKANTSVPATGVPQAFRAWLRFRADGHFPQGERELWFVVPAQ